MAEASRLPGPVIGRWLIAAVMFLAGWWLVQQTAIPAWLAQPQELVEQLQRSGWVGPLLVVGLMALAVVFNPLPSAPVALAAGALYGHGWGTLWVVLGATLGAGIAFLIARHVARDWVETRLQGHMFWQKWNDPNRLMAAVFVSRLLPFLSFDLVSYAAGLTRLDLLRFLLATTAGLVPASFLLAHAGGEMASGDWGIFLAWSLGLGALTLLPLLLGWWRHQHSPAIKTLENNS